MDFISGSSGFIGSHLAEALGDVVKCDIKDGSGDVRKPLDLTGIDRVFHLAGLADIVPSIENPAEYFETNVTGTLNVLEAARKAGIKKFVYAASSSCYGMGGGFLGDVCPQYPYALTKYLGEQLVMHWSQVYKIPAISLRLFNVYGLRQRTTGAYGAMFGTFLAQKANGLPMTIVGDGKQERDFVHVSDVVRAFVMAADSDCQGIYNVGSGSPESVNYIAKLIGGDAVHIPKRPGEPEVTWADITAIKRDIGWLPRVSIEAGVKELVEHLDDYKDAPVWDAASIGKATEKWFEMLG